MQTADRGWKPRPTPKDHHGSKPTGLWLSVVSEDGGDSWSDYCKTTDTPLKCWRTELLLNDDTIRWVRTPAEIDELTIEYGYCRVPEAEMFKDMIDHTRSVIYWERLAVKYSGIVIAPHCPERRRQQDLWYYTWDCASGCVWSRNAVRELGESRARSATC